MLNRILEFSCLAGCKVRWPGKTGGPSVGVGLKE